MAEFANYESWIAWVPFVALLAIPLALRWNLPLVLRARRFVRRNGLRHATRRSGRGAEQFGATLAIGLAAGAVAGALIGLLVQAGRTESASRHTPASCSYGRWCSASRAR